MRINPLIVTAFLFTHLTAVASAQLISDLRPANELLTESLLLMDELSTAYCARFEGEMSELKDDVPTLMNISGYSVKAFPPESSCFHSWGWFHVIGGSTTRQMEWNDALRVSATGKLFKIGQDNGNFPTHPNTSIESDESLKKDANAVWQMPELDPFGLVFGIEGSLTRNNSDFSRKRDSLLSAEFLKSENLKNGNVVGVWRFPSGKTRLTCEFDKQASYMPTSSRIEFYDEKTGKKGRVLGATRTRWKKYGQKGFVPDQITITSDRSSGGKLEVLMKWEWLPLEDWQRTKFDWNALLNKPLENLRKPFAELIEQSAMTAARK